MDFQEVAADLRTTSEMAKPLLSQLSDTEASIRPAPGKWAKKEILGHLLDSASNNHQRFVRAALQGQLTFPGYDQDALVELQRFKELNWKFLVELWADYNKLIAHVIESLPDNALQVRCQIGSNEPVTLGWMAQDYVAHMKHHLNQILSEKFETSYSAKA